MGQKKEKKEMPKTNKIIGVCFVRVSIPKKMLNKTFSEHKNIDFVTYQKTRRKLAEIESAIHQLQNVASLVAIISERWTPSSPDPLTLPPK